MYVRKNIGANKKIYLSLVHGYRDVKGKAKQKTIENFGYLEDLEKIYDDPIAHFKQVALDKTKEYNEEEKVSFVVNQNEKLETDTVYRKNVGYFPLKKYMKN